VRRALRALGELQDEIHAHEQAEGLELTRPLDAGFVDLAYRWARGDTLEDVLADEEITPGDFVRVTKQLIDLLQQVVQVAEDPALAEVARQAAGACQRGVVAYSGMI
jgi:ATP-dependent RNA helicase HelY